MSSLLVISKNVNISEGSVRILIFINLDSLNNRIITKEHHFIEFIEIEVNLFRPSWIPCATFRRVIVILFRSGMKNPL